VIAETLAGIALVKSAVDGIKSAINTANDVSEIAGYIDQLFEGEKQVQKKRAKNSGHGIGDQFGVNNIASEVIDARLAQEKMQEMRNLIDLRFGPGTWQSIIDERARRIQAAKEAAAVERRKKIQEAKEFEEAIKSFLLVATIVCVSLGLFVFLFMVVL
jgi:predicted PurR-regulated permease PerM